MIETRERNEALLEHVCLTNVVVKKERDAEAGLAGAEVLRDAKILKQVGTWVLAEAEDGLVVTRTDCRMRYSDASLIAEMMDLLMDNL